MINLFDVKVVWNDIFEIISFIPITLELTAWSFVIGLILGFLLALIKIKKIPVLNGLAGVYISFMRGTPILVQLYVTYFGIPILIKYINYYNGTNYAVAEIPSIIYAIAALALNSAAFNSVVIQSSFEAVNKGEVEAAAAIGMNGPQRMFRIIIPEAVELALPSLGNQLIGLLKGTSLAFSCAVVEMTAKGKILGAIGYRYFEAYVALAVLYWILTIVIEQGMKLIIGLVKVPDVAGKLLDDKIETVGEVEVTA